MTGQSISIANDATAQGLHVLVGDLPVVGDVAIKRRTSVLGIDQHAETRPQGPRAQLATTEDAIG